MKKILSLIVVLLLAFNVKAQGLAITEAADFTFSDNGTEKTLFDVLDNGQHALLFFLYYPSTSDDLAAIINGVYNNLGKNQNDVYMIGIDPANESILLNQWAFDYEVEYPLVAKDQGANSISQTYGGMTGVFAPALVLIAPNHDIILQEIWPITSVDQVVGIINENLVTGDDNTGDDDGDEPDTPGDGGEDPEEPGDEPEEPGDNPSDPFNPAMPTNIVATVTETTITLTWDAVEGATEYNIYTPANFDSNVLGITETTYTFENLITGVEYCFDISAVSATGESDFAKVCATPGDEPEEPGDGGEDPEEPGDEPEEPGDEPEEPVAPVVVADTVTETTVVLTWNAVENATSYNVYMDSVLVANVTDTTYTVDSLTAETTYSFTVTALADTLESVASNVVTVTTLKVEGIVENTIAFNIYPNPVNDKLYIEAEVEVENIIVYDIFGRHQVTETPSRQGNLTIDVSNLNSGIYFVKVVTENGEVVKRIVKK